MRVVRRAARTAGALPWSFEEVSDHVGGAMRLDAHGSNSPAGPIPSVRRTQSPSGWPG